MIGILVTICSLGIFSFWFQAAVAQHHINCTTFQGIPLSCNTGNGELIGVSLASLVLIVFTLGIAFPWVMVMKLRSIIENTSIQGVPTLTSIRGELDRDANAFAEGVLDSLEVFDSFAEAF